MELKGANLKKIEVTGDRISRQREAIGLKQAELAKRCNFSQSFLSKLENGAITRMRPHDLAVLAEALRTKFEYLTGQSDDFRPVELARNDENAKRVFEIYRSLNGSQIDELIRFGEYLMFGPERAEQFVAVLSGLYQYCRSAISDGKWNPNDPRLLAADELVAEIAIQRAIMIEEEARRQKAENSK